jgi:hypothetical protein
VFETVPSDVGEGKSADVQRYEISTIFNEIFQQSQKKSFTFKAPLKKKSLFRDCKEQNTNK